MPPVVCAASGATAAARSSNANPSRLVFIRSPRWIAEKVRKTANCGGVYAADGLGRGLLPRTAEPRPTDWRAQAPVDTRGGLGASFMYNPVRVVAASPLPLGEP